MPTQLALVEFVRVSGVDVGVEVDDGPERRRQSTAMKTETQRVSQSSNLSVFWACFLVLLLVVSTRVVSLYISSFFVLV